MGKWLGHPYAALSSGKEEDRFTGVLSELLKSPELLAAFVNDALAVDVADPRLLHATRERATFDGNVPDLVIRGNELFIVIEAKLGSWFHKGQIPNYLGLLQRWTAESPRGSKAYFFALVPGASQREAIEEVERHRGELRAQSVAVRAISWQRLADFCSGFASRAADSRLRVHLEEYAAAISARVGAAARPVTAEEAVLLSDPLVALALQNLRPAVAAAAEIIRRSPGYDINRYVRDFCDGFNIQRGGKLFWFGIWPDAWACIGRSPIVLELQGLDAAQIPVAPSGAPAPQVCDLAGGQSILVPLPIVAEVSPEKLAEDFAKIVRSYCDQL